MSNMSIAEPSGDQKVAPKVQDLQDERRKEGSSSIPADELEFAMDQEPGEGAGEDDEDYA
jgi:hypothetical protein